MEDQTPLDGFAVTSKPGEVILTIKGVFGDAIRYRLSPSDAAVIAASLLVHAVGARTT